MHMVRSHIKKRDTETKCDNSIDLDEKIRQIREKNKAREKRFKEIQDDKLNASSDGVLTRDLNHQKSHHENDQEKPTGTMPGVQNRIGRKQAKGRGQRLLEISKEPLKAKDFESKAVKEGLSQVKEIDLEVGKLSSGGDLSMELDRKHEQNNAFISSDVPSVGRNPLMDDRYTEKPKNDRHHKGMTDKTQNRRYGGFKNWDDRQPEDTHRKKLDRPIAGHGRKSHDQEILPKKTGVSGSMSTQFNKSMFSEDWNTEIMDIAVDEPKVHVENNAENVAEVVYPSQEQIQVGSHRDRVVGEDSYEETGIKTMDNNNTTKNKMTRPIDVDEDTENCGKLQELLSVTVKDGKDNNKNHNIKGGNDEGVATLVTDEPKLVEKGVLLDAEDKKASKIEGRPKITVNTKITKTVSNSSFDEVMSMLSPLDVPTNWGDCDFDDDLEAITF